MNCNKARLAITAEIDGEITATEMAALRAHLAACPECRGERDSLRALRQTLAVWDRPEPSDTIGEAFARRLHREQESRERGWRALPLRMPVYVLAPAAAAAIMILVYIGLAQKPPAVDTKPAPQVVRQLPEPFKTPETTPAEEKAATTAVPTPRPAPAVKTLAVTVRHRTFVVHRPAAAEHTRPDSNSGAAVVAFAPGAMDEAGTIARLEAEDRIAERVARLRTLMAEANDTIEGALISPASDESASSATFESEPDAAGTPI